ncbi:hypothetical protein SAMN04487970_106222 [Paenibacillus tianmuensis]|uniref:Uncharacterized protein n=1 Tax=Paenibacillus tianmuensis TaxID=624147 RepID=A0A1G4TQR9_9BACL|nr:hypothetical protein [Paenibacillus tianmuensis]SCW83736.1 hypothetical protein SAMN04487970_106222 [Paenibacillus tianmuensis]
MGRDMLTRRSREEILREVKRIQRIREKVMAGEEVKCPNCGQTLMFFGKDSGKHPGIYCPTDDFEILIEYDHLSKED